MLFGCHFCLIRSPTPHNLATSVCFQFTEITPKSRQNVAPQIEFAPELEIFPQARSPESHFISQVHHYRSTGTLSVYRPTPRSQRKKLCGVYTISLVKQVQTIGAERENTIETSDPEKAGFPR